MPLLRRFTVTLLALGSLTAYANNSSLSDQTTNVDSVAAPNSSIFNSNSVNNILPRMGIEYCDTAYVKMGVTGRADEPETAIVGVDFVIPLGTDNCVERVSSLREEIIRGKQLDNRAAEIRILSGVAKLCTDPTYQHLDICQPQ